MGRGLGRALMEHILDRAREAGFREAVAWSDVRLETAHQVYDRLGFERIGERDIDDIDQSHELGFSSAWPIEPAAISASPWPAPMSCPSRRGLGRSSTLVAKLDPKRAVSADSALTLFGRQPASWRRSASAAWISGVSSDGAGV